MMHGTSNQSVLHDLIFECICHRSGGVLLDARLGAIQGRSEMDVCEPKTVCLRIVKPLGFAIRHDLTDKQHALFKNAIKCLEFSFDVVNLSVMAACIYVNG